MAERRKVVARGAPAWMVSYGDMMGLLLCFFIMLVAMSELRKDERFRKVMQSLQQAFGYQDGMGTTISDQPPENSLLARLDEIVLKNFKFRQGNATDDGLEGTENTVKRIREGIEFTIGGQIGFASGSAELRAETQDALREVAQYVRGENNKIEVRGHATRSEAGPGAPFPDAHKLAYARASAVADFLVGLGVRPERIRRVDCGSSEPLVLRAYDDRTKDANRRVEIIVAQSLAQQFEGGEGEPPPPPPPSRVGSGGPDPVDPADVHSER